MHLSSAIEAFDLAMVGVVAPATRQWYERRLASLVALFGGVEISDITITDLRRWRAELVERQTRWADHPTRPTANNGLSPHTVHGYVRATRRFFAWLEEEQIIERNPARRLKLPALPDAEPKYIARQDLEKIVAAAKASSKRDYALVCFLADTGCRLAGVTGLRLGDLNIRGLRATVWEKGRGGNGRARAVFFTQRTADALLAYLAVRPASDSDRVWLGQRGPLHESGIYQVLKRLAKRAGIEGRWNPHSFRHGWAHCALESGADLGTVCQVLGHRDINTTHDHYGRWADGPLAERARRFSPLNNSAEDI